MLLLFLNTALAVPPALVPAADVAQPGLEVYWREGELLAGVPSKAGRPGVRPLADPTPMQMPADLVGWTPIGPSCGGGPSPVADLDGLKVQASLAGTADAPEVELRAGPRVIASYPLGRPARPCALAVVQADDLPGLEVLVVWRPIEDDELRGLRVFRIPDTAR